MNDFKPMLSVNEEPVLEDIKYPMLASRKLDGIRCIFIDGKMLSRSLKPIPNKQLQEMFVPLKEYSAEHCRIFDGELYDHSMTFQEISSMVMTQDHDDPATIKKTGGRTTVPDTFKFYCFDALNNNDGAEELDFFDRGILIDSMVEMFPHLAVKVRQERVDSAEEVRREFSHALNDDYEGLILKNPNGKYKHGRTTLKENLMYKVKPYMTFDAQIVEVEQGTVAREGSEKKINELGQSRTSQKKDDRVLVNKAKAFVVKYEDGNGVHSVSVSIAATDAEKEDMWEERETLIGKWIEYKGMLVGAKDVPRHPVFVRFREDRK